MHDRTDTTQALILLHAISRPRLRAWGNNNNNDSDNNYNYYNLQAFQLIILARYLLGGPKPWSCEPMSNSNMLSDYGTAEQTNLRC